MERSGLLHVSPLGAFELPELAIAPGPAAEGVLGDGSRAALYGRAWAVAWREDRPALVLLRADGDQLVEVEPLAPLPKLTVPARHITLAFDRTARPVIAWQSPDGILVRQYDSASSAYVLRGPFPGCDPCLVADGLLTATIGESDVQLWHLSEARDELVVRYERDDYGEPSIVSERPGDEHLIQVLPEALRLRVVLAVAEIANPEAAPADRRLVRRDLRSDLYPYRGADALTLTPAAPAAIYDLQVVATPEPSDAGSVTPSAPAASYTLTVFVSDDTDALSVTPSAPAATYAVQVVDPGPQFDAVAVSPSSPAATYALVVIPQTLGPDVASVTPSAPAATYQEV